MSLQITAQSALSTLRIVARQSQRDTQKIVYAATTIAQVLTSPAAIKRYRIAIHLTREILIIAGMTAIALGMSTRDLWEQFKRWSDAYVESCQLKPQPVEVDCPISDPSVLEATIAAVPLAQLSPAVPPLKPLPIAVKTVQKHRTPSNSRKPGSTPKLQRKRNRSRTAA